MADFNAAGPGYATDSKLSVGQLKPEMIEIDGVIYSPDTGEWWRRVPPSQRHPDRKEHLRLIGGSRSKGYLEVWFHGRPYLAHRLAFLFVTGALPSKNVDHRDGNPRNNAWANLREATQGENVKNARRRKDSLTGLKGVTKCGDRKGRWQAQIQSNGKRVILGRFRRPTAAHFAYVRAARELHGEFARGA